ncbi:MAG: RluA family pseudouridine synthase [Eubacterium sp.]|nr:RluA family pseudouridine synthase [Eubacterium sp.]
MNRERILYEDNDIIVCHKAAGIATQTARIGQADMVSEIANYLTLARRDMDQGQNKSWESSKSRKLNGSRTSDESVMQRQSPPPEPYVGVVHRLDQPVEGILVFAKNKHAAAGLGRQIAENRMEKYYYAVACGRELAKSGRLTDYLFKDGRTNTSRIVPPEVKDAKKAVLEYEIVSEVSLSEYAAGKILSEQSADIEQTEGTSIPLRIALVRICLHTGRHHQIRVQMSHAGLSLLGDYKYAAPEVMKISEQRKIKEIALCAYHLSFQHPKTGERMQFQIQPEGKCFQAEQFAEYNW